MSRVLQIGVVAACLPAILLVVSGHAAAAPLHGAAYGQLLSCGTARPALADFDENGIVDRVASRDGGSGAAGIWLTINGTRQIALVEAASACGLIVLDFDYDTDADLVAFTARGQLLVWRNEGGVLGLVSPQMHAARGGPRWTAARQTHAPDSAGLKDDSIADLPTARAHVLPCKYATALLAASAANRASNDSSPSRAPPSR